MSLALRRVGVRADRRRPRLPMERCPAENHSGARTKSAEEMKGGNGAIL
ncbi:MAG: hypothetical protein IKW80_01025 [Thermoguttaceae bacterium]|nr:hypothetical protein [Thermoguttaceae bacterium]